ncbi:RNA 3'-terminal phosphate cyclase/enolpyruvate transferase [Zopfochytrium polystomum]|nr:RNA 3'-terminal phosphate cyclase/enolpyruvate transferase [Zopfochytrium polystomum]
MVRLQGHHNFRMRLVLATLSGRPVRIDKIRQRPSPGGGDVVVPSDAPEDHTGLLDYEVSFLRLLEKVTNGSTVEISYSGTALIYRPGVIVGGKVEHACPTSRAIGYFLEPLIALSPFCKTPLTATLTGVTNNNIDVGVDVLRTVTLPVLRRFLPESTASAGLQVPLELKIDRRGLQPAGGGAVTFRCPTVRCLVSPSTLSTVAAPIGDGGRPGAPVPAHAVFATPVAGAGAVRRAVRRVRGVAYAARVAPAIAGRIADAARAVLTRFLPDVYVYLDVARGAEAGLSPGYGCALVAESLGRHLHGAECAAQPRRREVGGAVGDGDGGGAGGVGVDADGAKRRKIELERDDGEVVGQGDGGEDREVSDGDASDGDSVADGAGAKTLDELLAATHTYATPEDLGVRCARLLLSEIQRGGCIDTTSQWLVMLMMALGPEGDATKVRIAGGGELGSFLVQHLRDIKEFLGVEFRIVREEGEIVLTCAGSGYVNVNKSVA